MVRPGQADRLCPKARRSDPLGTRGTGRLARNRRRAKTLVRALDVAAFWPAGLIPSMLFGCLERIPRIFARCEVTDVYDRQYLHRYSPELLRSIFKRWLVEDFHGLAARQLLERLRSYD